MRARAGGPRHLRPRWRLGNNVALHAGGRWREAAAMLTIYTLASCDSCRKAVKWLRAHDVAFVEKAIRETPPGVGELKEMLRRQDGGLRKLFNTAGQDYRALGLKEKLPAMSEAQALELLASNGNLVKRPFLLGKKAALTGFDEAAWNQALL